MVRKMKYNYNPLAKKKRYYCIFCIKEQNVYVRLKKKRFDPLKGNITYKNRSFVIDVNKPSYSYKMKVYYFIDLFDDTQISFDTTGETMNSEVIDMVLHKHVIRDLATRLTANAMIFNIFVAVIGLIIGGLVGYVIAINTIETTIIVDNTNGGVIP